MGDILGRIGAGLLLLAFLLITAWAIVSALALVGGMFCSPCPTCFCDPIVLIVTA